MADGTTPIAVNVKKLSEDELIALEHAQAEAWAALDDYENGLGSRWFAERKLKALEALMSAPGTDDQPSAAGFARPTNRPQPSTASVTDFAGADQ